MILVIDNTQKSWSLKYKLFRSASDAVDYANSIGYSKSLIGLNAESLKPGILHQFTADGIDIELIHIEPESSTNKSPDYDHIGHYGC